jgi:uncharacterized protein
MGEVFRFRTSAAQSRWRHPARTLRALHEAQWVTDTGEVQVRDASADTGYRTTPLRRGSPVRERLVGPDRARGVALVGVVIVNLIVFAGDAGAGYPTNVVERSIAWTRDLLFSGKSYPVMAALFGYSLGLQMRRAGSVHRNRVLVKRRLAVLGVLGAVHGLLLYRYDILLAYAVLGFVAHGLRRMRLRSLVMLGSALFVAGGLVLTRSTVDARRLAGIDGRSALRRYQQGTFTDLVDLHLRNFAANLAGEVITHWPFALGMILVGVCAERVDAARRLSTSQLWRLVALGAAALGVAAYLSWPYYARRGVSANAALALTFVAPAVSLGAIGAVLLWSRRVPRPLAIDAFGRMSLTNYLLQSLLCNVTLYGFGLGLARHFRPSVQLLFATVTITAQMQWSKRWLATHEHGPVEWLVQRVIRADERPRPIAPTPEGSPTPG